MNEIDLEPILSKYSIAELLEFLIDRQYIDRHSARNWQIKREFQERKERGERSIDIITDLSNKYCLCERMVQHIVYEGKI